jgi:hypothetical protein
MTDDKGLVHCFRLSEVRSRVETEQALLFVELLKHKVPRNDALRFAQRQHCHYDASKTIGGPPKFRLIKSHPDQYSVKVNGWTVDPPVLTNDPILLEIRRIQQQQDWLAKMIAPTSKQIELQQRQANEKHTKLKNFYQNLDDKFCLKDLSRDQRQKKVQAIQTARFNNDFSFTDLSKNSLTCLSSVRDQETAPKRDSRKFSKEIADIKVSVADLSNRFKNHCRSVRGLVPFQNSMAISSGFKIKENTTSKPRFVIKTSEDKTEKGNKTAKKVDKLMLSKTPIHRSLSNNRVSKNSFRSSVR